MERVPALVAVGVTDFVGSWRIPKQQSAAEEKMRPVVSAFRSAVGRARLA
jgi:hypothetical protein